MWPSSRIDSRSARRGFTLIEAMVSLLVLVIVLLVAMTMLFQMRAFAERQQFYMLPRQTARRAAEYLGYYLAGASDLNDIVSQAGGGFKEATHRSPNAIVTYYNLGGALTQASYNNLTGSEAGNAVLGALGLRPANVSTKWGDVGTDILTLMAPSNPGRFPTALPFPALGPVADVWIGYKFGCSVSDAQNNADFNAATGFDGTTSPLLIFTDANGNWVYGRITQNVGDGLGCGDASNKNIHVTMETASATLPAPPNGTPALAAPVYLMSGIQPLSFRVLTDPVDGLPKLQQKAGLFDPNSDNPGTAFVNVMENVEDLQVAYMYPDGTIWNAQGTTLSSASPGCDATCSNGVPPQAGPAFAGTVQVLDIQNAIGIRLSITARSPLLTLASQKLTNVNQTTVANQHIRPASEDHVVAAQYDLFDHYRATTTMMLRNRLPKG